MKKSYFKRLLCLVLALVMLSCLAVPALAAPASNNATKESLEEMVRGYVEANYDQESVISSVEDYIAALVSDAVMAFLKDTDALLGYASPVLSDLINGMIKTALGEYNLPIDDIDISGILDSILNSDVIDTILSLQIVNDIIERTAEYAVKDALALTLGIGEDVAEADIETLVQKYTDEIFDFKFVPFVATNAYLGTSNLGKLALIGKIGDVVNPFWTISISGSNYNATGWQNNVNAPLGDIPLIGQYLGEYSTMEAYISARIAIDKFIATGENAVNFDLAELQAQLPDIIWNAAKRAAEDVVKEKIAELKAQIEATVKEAIVEAVNPKLDEYLGLADYLNTGMSFEEMGRALLNAPKVWLAKEINGFFGSIVVTGDMSFEQMADAVENMLKEMAQEKRQELIEKLDDLKMQSISWLKGYIQELIDELTGVVSDAKADLVAAINECFGRELVNTEMSFEEIVKTVEDELISIALEAKDTALLIIDKLEKKFEALKGKFFCIWNFIKDILDCCNDCKEEPEPEPEPEPILIGAINLFKTVSMDEEKLGIAAWMLEDGYTLPQIERILDDITFEVYHSNKNGDELEIVESVTGRINVGTSQITFYKDETLYDEFEAGWYLIREKIGDYAAWHFVNTDDLLIYFNGMAVTADAGPEFNEETTFTIEQLKGVTRPIQALFRKEVGGPITKYLRNAPWLNIENGPNGGGALGTSMFITTQDDGTTYTSFCADIGAVGVKGAYHVDPTNHGLSNAEVQRLVAALDYIYALDDTFFADEYERTALAQLIVWNMVITYSDDPMIADMWLAEAGVLAIDAWGELFKVEGYNNSNGANQWYTDAYKTLINSILEDPDAYVDMYKAKITAGNVSFVSGATFLSGDGSFANYNQQRQVIIWFGDPVTFDNTPWEGNDLVGELNLFKYLEDDNVNLGISIWLSENGLTEEEIKDILNDITFEVYYSNKAGAELGQVADVTGYIDYATSQIMFYDDVDLIYKGFTEGWYLIREKLGETAALYFEDVDDLHVYYNERTVTTDEDPIFDENTYFTINQIKGIGRPVQALYRKEADGPITKYLRTAPWLNVENGPNGGGALGTSKFIATQNDGTMYTSFCADIGAVGVKGKYLVDSTNHGLSDEEVFRLIAALDYIYALDNDFFADEYERIALAQLVVWNMVLMYSDNQMIAEQWLASAGVLSTEAWGTLFKIDGYNNTNGSNQWYKEAYKTLVDDILGDPDKYVSIYTDRVDEIARSGQGKYVGGGIFLIGDGSHPDYYQQRQFLIWFRDPVSFENISKDNEPVEPELSFTVTVYDTDENVVYTGDFISGEIIDYAFDGIMFLLNIYVKDGADDPITTFFIFGDEFEETAEPTDEGTFTLVRNGETVIITLMPN